MSCISGTHPSWTSAFVFFDDKFENLFDKNLIISENSTSIINQQPYRHLSLEFIFKLKS